MPFEFKRLEIPDVLLVQPKVFGDSRGFFVETYKYNDFEKAGIAEHFVQDNHSKSVKGVLRGLHYQKLPKPQSKLVRCTSGEIFDVAVDIRKGSPTFGKWVGANLSDENRSMLYIPEGFAHGFQTLADNCELLYQHSEFYTPEAERGIRYDDSRINIRWPLNLTAISDRDRNHPAIDEKFEGV